MKKRSEYLKQHPYKIWKGKNGGWFTYLPDEEHGRIMKRRTTKRLIEDCVISYYYRAEEYPCFREVYYQWISEKASFDEVGENTLTRYNNDFKRFFPPGESFCKVPLCEMTDSVLEKFIKRTIQEKELTAKSYSMLRLLIIGVFKFAKREGYTNYSITTFFKDLSLPSNIFKKRIRDTSMEIFNDNESKLLMDYFVDNPTLVNLGLAFNFYCGLRVGELSTLKKSDNNTRNILRVHRTEIVYNDSATKKRVTVVKEYPKTDSGVREIIIPDSAQEILDRIIEQNPSGEYLFMKNGKRITTRMFNYYLKKACKQVGIPSRSTHKIRKTYGSKLLQNDVDSAIVTKQMGHKDISTTQNYYHYDITTDSKRKHIISNAICY